MEPKTDQAFTDLPELPDEDSEEKTDKSEEINDLSYCDIYTLFNALQFEWNKLFIDIRPKLIFVKTKINYFINIPFDILSSDQCDEIIIAQILNAKKQRMQNMYSHHDTNAFPFEAIYAVSGNKNRKMDIEVCEYIKKLIADTFDHQKTPIIMLNTGGDIFCRRFPFLCHAKEDEVFKYPSQIVNDELFLGNRSHATTKQVLMDLGITHVINMTTQSMDQMFDFDPDLNIKYLQCAIYDDEEAEIQSHFEKGIAFIVNALHQNNPPKIHNRVLIHCQSGVSRSATMVIAYLMKMKHMCFKDAYKYTQHRREIIEPNDGFVQQLKLYEKNQFVFKKQNDYTGVLGII
eukprot:98493_1